MCTAAVYLTNDLYFGRNLDYEFSYGESIAVMPRNYPLPLSGGGRLERHYAMIGMAHVAGGYPLYYDAVNEKGLCIAGLNFVGNAVYRSSEQGRENVAQYELIPWLLGQCASADEAVRKLEGVNLTGTPFSPELPAAQLHWLLADRDRCVVLESVANGLNIYDDPAGVLTNNPPFPMQLFALNNFAHLSPRDPENTFAPDIPLKIYSRGMGGLGLPGDLSSQSRFIRASFVRANSRCDGSERASVSQFFHILGSVEQQRGCCELPDGKYELTIYSSCCNADKGIYYYRTYDAPQINAVRLVPELLNTAQLMTYPMLTAQSVNWQN